MRVGNTGRVGRKKPGGCACGCGECGNSLNGNEGVRVSGKNDPLFGDLGNVNFFHRFDSQELIELGSIIAVAGIVGVGGGIMLANLFVD